MKCATQTLAAAIAATIVTAGTAYGSLSIGDKVGDFELTDHTGKVVKLADYADQIVVLEWCNDGCPVWRGVLETLKSTAGKYDALDNVVWLAVNSTRGKSPEANAKIVEKFGLNYAILDDASGKVGRALGARTTPHMFVVNKGVLAYQGAIDNRKKGDDYVNYVAKALDELLAGETVTTPETKPYGCGVKYAN